MPIELNYQLNLISRIQEAGFFSLCVQIRNRKAVLIKFQKTVSLRCRQSNFTQEVGIFKFQYGGNRDTETGSNVFFMATEPSSERKRKIAGKIEKVKNHGMRTGKRKREGKL